MAQPAINDVLTWDGTKGVYTANPASALALPNTYIFVGNALAVATGVPLTLSVTPGAFALANTGVLTMPDASVTGRGLLNASAWTTAGYLYNNGAGVLQWQASTTETLAATLAAGNNVGGFGITATDGTASLNLTTSSAILYANVGSVSAPRLTLDQGLGLARLASQNGTFEHTATEALIQHTARITFTAPAYRYSNLTLNTVPYINATLDMVSSTITPTELGYLTGATSAIQAQIDALVSGLSWKQAVRVRTTANITLSGTQVIDSVSVIAGDRVLVMNQTSAPENGIYICAAGAWVRSADANTGAELLQATVATQEGTLYADQQFVCTTNAPITIGVTNITFVLVGGTTYVGTTNRITVTGNVIDIAATYVGQTSITTLGTITTGVWNGTAIANANLANSTITINGNATSLGGTVTITSTGTANRISVTGGGGLAPTIDIAATYVGQTSITTLGTVTTGTLGTGAVISGVTMTLGADASFDIYYRSGTGVLTRLANGTTGQALMANTGAAPSWGAAGSGTVTSVAWTTSQGVSAVIATATTTPNITITLGALTGVTSFNGLVITANTGVVTTGTWNATVVGSAYGGTGIANNAASTIAVTGNFATTFTISGITTVTLPTSGTLYGTLAGSITSAQMLASLSDETGTGLLVFATNPTISGATFADATDIVFNSTTGTKIGTATTQKLAFYNSIPIVQPTGDIVTALQNLGLGASLTVTTTTNANLTGPITSVGNATSIASQTGTGTTFAMSVSPTFTTSITTPLIIGGTGVTSKIRYDASSNAAPTSTVLAHDFMIGASAGVQGLGIYHDGQFLVNTTTRNPGALGIVRIAQGTSTIDIGERSASAGSIWFSQTTPSTSNYALQGTSASTNLGATTTITIAINNSARITQTAANLTFTPALSSSTIPTAFLFTGAAHTGLTATSECIDVNWNLARTVGHATGAITNQRSFLIQASSHSFVGASTITDASTLAITGATSAGTNATITNSHGIIIQSIAVGSGVTNSYGLTVNAQTGATDNFAAQFIGGDILMKGASANSRVRNARLLYRDTTDATITELTTDGAAGSGSTNRIKVPLNTAMSVVLNICVKQTGSANSKQMLRQFLITNNGGVTSIEGTVTALGTDVGSAALTTASTTITANDTDDCVKVEVTGVAATSLRWTAYIVSTEVIYT